MIAHAGESLWASRLANSLSPLPWQLHWPRTGDEALGLATRHRIHVAVVDDDLPDAGGRGVVQGFRHLGLELPCLLVCRNPEPRVLQDAIRLDVFSVVEAEGSGDLLPPMIFKVIRRVYDADWPMPDGFSELNN